MRLHHMRFSAFLAFPGQEEVDFDALGESGLFLLQGRTGAGKTSLLDAVCFAFYGDVPGARSDGARLRSDHAAPEMPTEVQLEATLRGQRIRIDRRPEQERPKLRGTGTTVEAHRVTVVAIDDDGTERVIATRHDEARQELDDLLGMTREQFCQVVLLPQGGFAKFLHARSDDREKLLRELFDVGRFSDVERWLKGRRQEAESVAGDAMRRVQDLVAQATQVAGAEPPEDWETAPETLNAWVQEQLVVTEASTTTAGEAATATIARDAQAARTLTESRERAARQAEHVQAKAALEAWEAKRSARDLAFAELESARQAAPAKARIADLQERVAAARDAREQSDVAVAAARDAGVDPTPSHAVAGPDPAAGGSGAHEAAAGQRTDVPAEQLGMDFEAAQIETPAPSDEVTALRAAAADLRRAAGSAEALTDLERTVDANTTAVAALESNAARLQQDGERLAGEIVAAEGSRAALDSQLVLARAAAARVPGLVEAEDGARVRASRGAERDGLMARLQGARDALLGAREGAVAAREHHADLLQRRLDGIAAELAGRLVEGESCAVCGSLEHPAPAAAPDGGMVTVEDVAAAQDLAHAQEAARERLADGVARLEAELSAALAVAGDAPLSTLREAAEAAQRDLVQAQGVATDVERHEATLSALAATLEDLVSRRRAAEVQAGEAATEARERATALVEDRTAVQAARAGEPSIALRVWRLASMADQAESAAAALETAQRCDRELDAARARAQRAASDAGFADLAQLRAALRDASACDDLELRIRAWDEGLAERRTRALRPELATAAAAAVPDLAQLEHAATQARDGAERAQRELALAQQRHEGLERLRVRLGDALDEAIPARERLAVVRELADLTNGTANSNRLRMRLSAYVLAARLEEVAAAASVRLQRMSGGRYALEHADDGAKGNRRGGLDLRVIDAWTGHDRAPSSLSGGETFQASLALALGLADVVTAEAGGARLETLFVDEGFGSLDDEGTLDQVLEVLDGLRDGGRTIGIVSHVAELRQRIPMQLRVEKGQSGSHLAPMHAAGVG